MLRCHDVVCSRLRPEGRRKIQFGLLHTSCTYQGSQSNLNSSRQDRGW